MPSQARPRPHAHSHIKWALSQQADVYCLVLLQYAIDEAVRREAVDLDAFVDAARTHGFGMWKLDCRSDLLCCFVL